MYTIKILGAVAAAQLLLFACNKSEDDNTEPTKKSLVVKKFENLHAPQKSDRTKKPPLTSGPFVKFDFSSGDTTQNDKEWDIAFRGTIILVNGGKKIGIQDEPEKTGSAAVYIADGTFSEIKTVDAAKLKSDAVSAYAIPIGSGKGWYNYNSSNHVITPIPGKVLVIKTADGRYAKIEILSYYKDAPSSDKITKTTASRYYTFNYVYQPEKTASF